MWAAICALSKEEKSDVAVYTRDTSVQCSHGNNVVYTVDTAAEWFAKLQVTVLTLCFHLGC